MLDAGLTENSASPLATVARARPAPGFFGLKTISVSDVIPIASLPEGFFGQNWKLGGRAKSEFRPRWTQKIQKCLFNLRTLKAMTIKQCFC